jgi:hypothetical protein
MHLRDVARMISRRADHGERQRKSPEADAPGLGKSERKNYSFVFSRPLSLLRKTSPSVADGDWPPA